VSRDVTKRSCGLASVFDYGVEDIILQCRFVVLAFVATHRQFFVTTLNPPLLLYVTVFMNSE